MPDFLSNLDLNNNQIENVVVQILPSDPTGVLGKIIYNSTSNQLKYYNGSAWQALSSGSAVNDATITFAGSNGVTVGATTSFTTNDATPATITFSLDDFTALAVETVEFNASQNNFVISDTVNGNRRIPAGVVDVSLFNNDAYVDLTTAQNIGGNKTFDDNVIVTGDLTVNGTTTTIDSNTVNIGDNIIVLNSDETGTPTQDAGIEVERGTEANVQLRWDENNDDWEFQAYNHAATPALVTYKIPRTYKTNATAASNIITHNLGTKNVIVQMYNIISDETVFGDVERTSTNTITVSFNNAPGSPGIQVLIMTAD